MMLAAWLALGLAWGGGFYLEAPPVDARAEAVALQERARSLGLEARVTRRYRHGSGWEFVVVVEGFEDRPGAEQAAQALAEETGQGIAVYRLEGAAASKGDGEPAPSEEPSAQLPDATELIQRAARALGGPQGGLARLQRAEGLRFRYVRTIAHADGTLVADHDWVASGPWRRVAITVPEGGKGVASTVVGGPQGSWVTAAGETRDAQPAPTATTLGELSPSARLAWPLVFAATAGELGPFRVARQEVVGARTCWVLIAVAPTQDQPTRLWLDTEHGRPLRVDFATDAGRVEVSMGDWREPDTGLVVPHVLEVRRDGRLVERIEVAELTLDPELPDALFVRPREG